MPSLNPWIYVGVLLAFVGIGLGGYFYGTHVGANSVKAKLADDYQAALQKFAGDAAKASAQATADALKDFAAKSAVLDKLQASITAAQGVINAASSKLAASLKNSCSLTVAQRALLECVRRPDGPGCKPAPATQ